MLIRSGLGLSFGVVFSVLLFKRRAWPAFVGLGFGAGRAWEECDNVRDLPTMCYELELTSSAVIQASSGALERRSTRDKAISSIVLYPMELNWTMDGHPRVEAMERLCKSMLYSRAWH